MTATFHRKGSWYDGLVDATVMLDGRMAFVEADMEFWGASPYNNPRRYLVYVMSDEDVARESAQHATWDRLMAEVPAGESSYPWVEEYQRLHRDWNRRTTENTDPIGWLWESDFAEFDPGAAVTIRPLPVEDEPR